MKRVIIALLLIPALAAAQDRMSHVPSITVNGQAEERVAPDMATVRLGIVARGETAAAAQNAANEVMERLLKAITALGIERKDIQTSNLMLNPVYDHRQQSENRLQIIGYEARQTVSVTVTNLSLIGRVIDGGVTAGANNVEGVFFGLRNDDEARKQALRRAVANAREKAEAMAEAAGVRLVGILDINEAGAQVMPRFVAMEARAMGGMDASTQVEPGQLTVNAHVIIRWQIQPR